MEAILYIFAKVISLMIGALSLAMSARVIMQLVSMLTSHDLSDNKFYLFAYTVTELYVTPFRYLCSKFNLFMGTPIDAPFFIAYLSLVILDGFLPLI
jgi:hypothetical protein